MLSGRRTEEDGRSLVLFDLTYTEISFYFSRRRADLRILKIERQGAIKTFTTLVVRFMFEHLVNHSFTIETAACVLTLYFFNRPNQSIN